MSIPIKKTLVAVAAVGACGLGGAAIVQAGSDDGDRTVSGAQADSAKAAALRITHGGMANSVERDGENGATWEVEVARPDGTTVDVRLDAGYGLVVVEGDGGG
jgi:uncharacterized membrane protein YkoI